MFLIYPAKQLRSKIARIVYMGILYLVITQISGKKGLCSFGITR